MRIIRLRLLLNILFLYCAQTILTNVEKIYERVSTLFIIYAFFTRYNDDCQLCIKFSFLFIFIFPLINLLMKLASKKLASNPMFSLIRILRFYEMYDIVVKFWLVVCVCACPFAQLFIMLIVKANGIRVYLDLRSVSTVFYGNPDRWRSHLRQ